MPQQSLIVVAGPTGSGKSELALRLAEMLGGEIVNYDSVQIYRGFDIGSAKPSAAQRQRVPHHLFDILDADDGDFNAADYAKRAHEVCADIQARGKRVILAGGTFFYLRALLSGLPEMPGRDEPLRDRLRAVAGRARGAERLHRWLSKIDPQSGRKIALADRHRVERALEVWITSGKPISSWERDGEQELPSVKLALDVERKQLAAMLDARVEIMFRNGLVDETRSLLEQYPATADRSERSDTRRPRRSCAASWRKPRPSPKRAAGPAPTPSGNAHGCVRSEMCTGWTGPNGIAHSPRRCGSSRRTLRGNQIDENEDSSSAGDGDRRRALCPGRRPAAGGHAAGR